MILELKSPEQKVLGRASPAEGRARTGPQDGHKHCADVNFVCTWERTEQKEGKKVWSFWVRKALVCHSERDQAQQSNKLIALGAGAWPHLISWVEKGWRRGHGGYLLLHLFNPSPKSQ